MSTTTSGKARWQAIKNLVEELKEFDVPVLGNGDIWSAQDALEMVKETGCPYSVGVISHKNYYPNKSNRYCPTY